MRTFELLNLFVRGSMRHCVRIICLSALWAAITSLQAQPLVNEQVSALLVKNYTGYVIDADIFDSRAAYDREVIQVEAQIRSVNSSPTSGNSSYVAQFRLLNSGGNPHPIVNALGEVGDGLSIRVTNSFSIGPSAIVTVTRAAGIKPVSRQPSRPRRHVCCGSAHLSRS